MPHRTEHPTPTNDLRRAAFRAAKMLDRTLVPSDTLLAAVEDAYAAGTDTQLARAVTTIVQAAESRPGAA